MSVGNLQEAIATPGELFEPNSIAQERFLTSRAPELLYSGHYGCSKTRTICEKADILCRQWPGAKVILARKKREDMGQTTLPVLLNEVIHPEHREWGWSVAADGGSMLRYPNGSAIVCVGLDRPGKLRSGAYLAAFWDQCEEADLEEWLAIGGRLRQMRDDWREYDFEAGEWVSAYHQLGGACNPESPAHFLYKRFNPTHSHQQFSEKSYELPNGKTIPSGRLVREVILAQRSDNVENLDDDYLIWLQSLTGRYRERYVEGKWKNYEGSIYEIFDPGVHIIDRPAEWDEWGGNPPPHWSRSRGIDFGYVNPFVHQWWARSPKGTWFMYREIYHSRRRAAQHAEQILEIDEAELAALNAGLRKRGLEEMSYLPFRWSYSDHSMEERATLEAAPYYIATSPADKDVTNGIQTVHERMAVTKNAHGRAVSQLYFIRDALVEADPVLVNEKRPTCTVEEIPAYKFKNTLADTKRDKPVDEKPIKVDDHGCDAMRYLHHSQRMEPTLEIAYVHEKTPGVEETEH